MTAPSIAIAMNYRDVVSLELGTGRKTTDALLFGVKKTVYTFINTAEKPKVFRILQTLCNAAMNRLIKGAENSISASSEMFSKHNNPATGDLAVTIANRAGGLAMGFSKDEYASEVLDSSMGDLTGQRNSLTPTSPSANPTLVKPYLDPPIVRYSHIKVALVDSLADLDDQTKQMEFRNLFRMSFSETITLEEPQCYYFSKTAGVSHQGKLYLSQNFVNFCSVATSGNTSSTSLLVETSQDAKILFTIPYSHIVAVQKQSPASLLGSGKALSLSGYLVISTKNRYEFWMSFGNVKTRDGLSDALLSRIKTTEWNFDDDLILGARNGPLFVPIQHLNERHGPLSPTLDGSSSAIANLVDSQSSKKDFKPLQTGLKFLTAPIIQLGSPVNTQYSDQENIFKWAEYFESNGKDVCIVKDIPRLRELLFTTHGVPDLYRGDFWMLVSGAWISRPPTGYYERLLIANQDKKNPFAEEIEKDVRRSLPEHPAFQSSMGIDALRRVLTAFSWRNAAIGYAQALNIIAAVLLLHLREDDAFWILCVIVERMLPDHYTKTLVGSVVDQSVYTQLVHIHLPNLSAHLNKLYLDLSTFSVPWFLCLYLNSVNMQVAIKFLDNFFLEGPKFLFWIALGVLKVNEQSLISRGKDDDIFVAILKDFFARLGLADSAGSSDETQDVNVMTGKPLYALLLETSAKLIGSHITNDTIESLRIKYRLAVVHQMEDTNRKSQIRTLCEQVSMNFEEIGIVYDQVRALEFIKGQEEENPDGYMAQASNARLVKQEELLEKVAHCGGWGLCNKYQPPQFSNSFRKNISLLDFQKVFTLVSPFNSALLTPGLFK